MPRNGRDKSCGGAHAPVLVLVTCAASLGFRHLCGVGCRQGAKGCKPTCLRLISRAFEVAAVRRGLPSLTTYGAQLLVGDRAVSRRVVAGYRDGYSAALCVPGGRFSPCALNPSQTPH
jgi:hypothetical protein